MHVEDSGGAQHALHGTLQKVGAEQRRYTCPVCMALLRSVCGCI